MVITRKWSRWYDGMEHVTHFIRTMTLFPDDIQTILCESILHEAKHDFKTDEMVSTLRSLGMDNIQRLWKSTHKRRFYDRNPILHKTMTYISIMAPENQSKVVHKANDLVDVTLEYFEVCTKAHQKPSLTEIATMSKIYLEEDAQHARRHLNQLRNAISHVVVPADLSTRVDKDLTLRTEEGGHSPL